MKLVVTWRFLLLLFLAASVLLSSCDGNQFAKTCEERVKDHLVSPRSADFDMPLMELTNDRLVGRIGYVHSHNRLGVMVRTSYACFGQGTNVQVLVGDDDVLAFINMIPSMGWTIK